MTNTTITDQFVNASEFTGYINKGNRVWGPIGTIEIQGDQLEDLLAACEKSTPIHSSEFFEVLYVLDELDGYGGEEGDFVLSEIDLSDDSGICNPPKKQSRF